MKKLSGAPPPSLGVSSNGPESFPVNRLGRKVAWSKWFESGVLPDTEHRCCLCGRRGSTPHEFGGDAVDTMVSNAFSQELPRLIKGRFTFPKLISAFQRLVDPEISRSMRQMLVPYHVSLTDEGLFEQVTKFFSEHRLAACMECLLLSGEALYTTGSLVPKRSNKPLATGK